MMTMQSIVKMLTVKQSNVLNVIREFIRNNQRQPTLEEVGFKLGIGRSTVHKHVQALIKAGLLFESTGKFAYEYVDGNRTYFDALSPISGHLQFVPDTNQLAEFLAYGGYGIVLEDLSVEDKKVLSQLLQAAIARNYFGYNAYRDVLLEYDPILNKVYQQARSMLQ